MFKKGALTGLLLFGIFFGAGNLIFPPTLGALSGEHFWSAIAGFVLSGVGIAILTLIIGTLNPKGYVYEISKKVSPWFATGYLIVLYLAIGPFFAIPRTATTSYEVGIAPLLSSNMTGLGLIIFTILYFVAAYLISLNPSKILDRIGRILTPVFAILIVILVILGAIKYGAAAPQAASTEYAKAAFGTGFLEGYNTLDALASVAFSVIAVQTLNQLGFANKKEYISTIWIVGVVVALGFSALYIGLGFLGNHFPIPADVMASDANKGVDGKTYKLSDFKGKKVYLKFWASWCSICLSTLKDTDELAKNAGKDYVVLTVVSPGHVGEKSEADFKNWYEKLNYKHLPVLLDPSGKLLEQYGVRSYPTAAFIGSDGKLVKTRPGLIKKAEIESTLKSIK